MAPRMAHLKAVLQKRINSKKNNWTRKINLLEDLFDGGKWASILIAFQFWTRLDMVRYTENDIRLSEICKYNIDDMSQSEPAKLSAKNQSWSYTFYV
jgi:hypothetical protein